MLPSKLHVGFVMLGLLFTSVACNFGGVKESEIPGGSDSAVESVEPAGQSDFAPLPAETETALTSSDEVLKEEKKSQLLTSCPEEVSLDAAEAELAALPVFDVTQPFEVSPYEGEPGMLYTSEQGFAIVVNEFGEARVAATSSEGMTWSTYTPSEAPSMDEIGVDRSQPSSGSLDTETVPGFGGSVHLIHHELGSIHYLCLPATEGEGVMLQALPFGYRAEFENPHLIGVVDNSLYMTVQQVDSGVPVFHLGDVNVVAEPSSEGIILLDQESGARVDMESTEDGMNFVYLESGELIASLSQEEFMELGLASALTQDAMAQPAVQYRAWSKDRAQSWQVAKLPDQNPETSVQIQSVVVAQNGTVVLLVQFSPFGRLFNPTELTGPVTEEEFDQAIGEQLEGEFDSKIIRTQVQ